MLNEKQKKYIAKNQNIIIIITVKKRKTNKYGIHKTKLKNITRDFDITRMMAKTSFSIKEIEYNPISLYCVYACTCQNNKNMCTMADLIFFQLQDLF